HPPRARPRLSDRADRRAGRPVAEPAPAEPPRQVAGRGACARAGAEGAGTARHEGDARAPGALLPRRRPARLPHPRHAGRRTAMTTLRAACLAALLAAGHAAWGQARTNVFNDPFLQVSAAL